MTPAPRSDPRTVDLPKPLGDGRVAVRWIAIIAVAFLAHVVYLNCVAEDAFIALRFAKNLATGHGLVWNPGTPPVEGYTDFLWVIAEAAAMSLGIPGVAFAQTLSIASGLATLGLTYLIGRRLMDWPPTVALIPCGLLALCGPFATWSSSGMEQTLFGLLILWGAYEFGWYWHRGDNSAALRGSVALLMATLTRPEGVMIALLVLGTSLALAMFGQRNRILPLLSSALVYGVGFTIYFAWRFSHYGYLLPNTFYAKTGGGIPQVLRGGLLAYLFLMQFALPLVPAALVTAWETGAPTLAGIRSMLSTDWLRRWYFTLLAALICIAYTANNVLVGGDYMAMHRFFVPVLPFMYLLFGLFVATLYGRIAGRANAFGFWALMAFVALATFFPSTPLERSFFASPPQQHGDYRGVQIERWHVARLSVIGKFFDRYKRDPSESLATTAIGAIGYFADMRIDDIHGLVDTHIAHLPPPPDFAKRRAGHGRSDLKYTFSLQPTYVMFSRDLTSKPIDLWQYVPEDLRSTVERDYTPTSTWLSDERNGESGYFTFFERRDSAARRANGS
jgi:arabinofuranosyltransferase